MLLTPRMVKIRIKKHYDNYICDEGRKVAELFHEQHPNGFQLTVKNVTDFINRNKLTRYEIGIMLEGTLQLLNRWSEASEFDYAFEWKYTKKDKLVAKFFELLKEAKLIK